MVDVHETRDVALLRRLLESDRVAGAYLLGDLEAPFFEKGRWLVATRDGSAIAVVLVLAAFAEPVVLSFGDVEGVRAIVVAPRAEATGPRADAAGPRAEAAGPRAEAAGPRAEARGLRSGSGVPSAASGGGRRSDVGHRTSDIGRLPSRCHLKIPPEHEAAFAAGFEILERGHMLVMALDRCDYRPATSQHDVRRLDASSPVAPILDVYRSYPGHFFEPGQLSSGIHFGSFECDRLVAVAGTHVYSPAGRVAAVGNIVTVSDARGRGHAAACTSAVIEAVYERGCETIVLHVAATNAPALACYRRLGFHDHGPILQLRGSESG